MSDTATARRAPRAALIAGGLAGCLAGCLESGEERAARAYDSFDFATARALAAEAAAEGSARGRELLALMAAQGLGRPVDYAEAFAEIDRAIALDPAYADTRAAIEARIAAARADAERAFAEGRHDRAYALARPLAAFGDEAGAALETALVTGHHVALPGSDMSWRAFRERCSGANRYEDESEAAAVFDSECQGRAAVWDGVVSRVQGGEMRVKMRPGRAGSRPDLALELAAEPDRALALPGAKVRFAGTVAARGEPGRPDRLAAARVLGPAPLTPEESARAEAQLRHAVAGACQRLAAAAFRADHMPEWAAETERRVVAGGSPRSRAFSLHVGVSSGLDVFQPAPDGGWRGVFDGSVAIQSAVARAAQVTEFTAECALDSDYRKGVNPAGHGAFAFLAMSEPRVESAPARLRR